MTTMAAKTCRTAPSFRQPLPNLLVESVEARIAPCAWSRPRDPEFLLDPARMCRQENNAVGQNEGLVDRVSDEDNGLLAGFPDPQELLLQLDARELVESAEGLVHEEDPWIEG